MRPLGDGGPRVSPIGLGTVKIGRNTLVKYPQPFDLPSDEDVVALIDAARHLGINLIDTAPAYGTSESRLGELLTDRENWLLCSKVGETGPGEFDFSPAGARRSVEGSLRRLRTDYLDLLLIHSDGNDEAILSSPLVQTLTDLRTEGLVRQVGASTKTVRGGLMAVDALDVVMVALNPDDVSQLPVVEAAGAAGKGILVKKALASGHAADMAGSLAFVLGKPIVSSVVVGTLNPQHLAENVAAARGF